VKATSRSVAAPLVLLLSIAPAAARSAQTPPGSSPEASYEFALGKLLAVEGSVDEAIEAFDRALKLAVKGSDASYILLEEAQLLSRRAQFGRNPTARQADLHRAVERLAEARRTAPENLDVLRAIGSVNLDLAANGDAAAVEAAREAFEAVRQRDPDDVQTAIALGRIYLDEDQPGRAAEVLRQLVDHVPQERMGYALLVEALLRANRGAEAEKALLEILSFDPGSLEARLTLADQEAKRGDAKAVIDTLRAAPESAQGDSRLRRQLAAAEYQMGDLDSALQLTDALIKNDPEEASLQLLHGLILAADGQNERALADLMKVAVRQGKDVPLNLTITRVLERLGRRAEAAGRLIELATVLEGAGQGREAQEVRLEAAQLYLALKDWPKVEAVLAPLAGEKDATVRAQTRMVAAQALAGAGRVEEALTELAKEASTPALEAKKGELLLKAGRKAEGEQVLAALAEKGDAAAQVAAAQAYQRVDRYGDSIPLLQRVAAQQASLPIPGFLLGAAYERSGRRDEAVAELRRVLKLDPNFHAALNYLGYTYAEAGENLDEALDLVQRAVSLDPDNGAYIDSLGWTYFRLGRNEAARGYLERAARLEPEDATLQEHLGDVYAAVGQKDRARQAYRRALELDPTKTDTLRGKLDALDAKRR
jgi:tetratricopeptide (TPR) repeat protein